MLGYLVPVGNRVWSIDVAVTDEFFENQGTNAILAPLLAGGLVSIAITALVGVAFWQQRS